MKIKELKNSLAKLGSDDDESHVLLMMLDENGEKKYGIVSFTAVIPTMNAIILGDEASLRALDRERGNLLIPENQRDMGELDDEGNKKN